ncbi:fasciclin domain-containing protein [Aurantibacter sp.]|uniref:fasciclin domain-containing protein n=1 Tax=Aurantibacter sp. TaxID=2807103 RepID=UPI0032654110
MKFLTSGFPIIFLFFSLISSAQNNSYEFLSEMDPEKSILTNTADSENYKTLLEVMRASELEELLADDGPFTVFAPTDSAFEKLPRNKVAELLKPENRKELKDLMAYHIVAGNFSASKILKAMCRGNGTATFTTVQGNELTATMQGIDIILSDSIGNSAKITTADANQCNGVMHEIDGVITPGNF